MPLDADWSNAMAASGLRPPPINSHLLLVRAIFLLCDHILAFRHKGDFLTMALIGARGSVTYRPREYQLEMLEANHKENCCDSEE